MSIQDEKEEEEEWRSHSPYHLVVCCVYLCVCVRKKRNKIEIRDSNRETNEARMHLF